MLLHLCMQLYETCVLCMQTCRWEFLVFSGTFDTHLTVEEDRPAGRVVFNLVNSAFMRSFQGLWQVRGVLPLFCLFSP